MYHITYQFAQRCTVYVGFTQARPNNNKNKSVSEVTSTTVFDLYLETQGEAFLDPSWCCFPQLLYTGPVHNNIGVISEVILHVTNT